MDDISKQVSEEDVFETLIDESAKPLKEEGQKEESQTSDSSTSKQTY